MPNIIRIEPISRVFSITWNLGARCNYDCMYCPSRLHDSTSPHKTIRELKAVWIDIVEKTQQKNLKYKISITGGEVTGNRDFIPFLTWLNNNYKQELDKILLTTNGSATLKYYQKLLNLVDNISFSMHSEHINEQKFFNTVIDLHKNLSPGKHIHVNIMNEWWNQDRIKVYCDILAKHQISHNINQIDYSSQTRNHPIMKGKLNLAITST